MRNDEIICRELDQSHIPYELYYHDPAFTMDECSRLPFLTQEITMCKNLLLSNRQQSSFYLLVTRPKIPFRTGHISRQLGSSRLSFAPEEKLMELLGVKSGSVSPLSLWFDKAHRVQPVFDRELQKVSRIAFHPLVNTATVIFNGETFWNHVVPLLGADPLFINCDQSRK